MPVVFSHIIILFFNLFCEGSEISNRRQNAYWQSISIESFPGFATVQAPNEILKSFESFSAEWCIWWGRGTESHFHLIPPYHLSDPASSPGPHFRGLSAYYHSYISLHFIKDAFEDARARMTVYISHSWDPSSLSLSSLSPSCRSQSGAIWAPASKEGPSNYPSGPAWPDSTLGPPVPSPLSSPRGI